MGFYSSLAIIPQMIQETLYGVSVIGNLLLIQQ
jgi:hypothetical protein